MESVVIERRSSERRHAVAEHGIESARIRPGHDAVVVNISSGGALIETSCRLFPDRTVDLHLGTGSVRVAVRARVLRCAVVALGDAGIRYLGAVRFDTHFSWMDARYAAGTSEGPVAHNRSDGEATTRAAARPLTGILQNAS
jgi:hypothetical protein